MKMLGAPPEPQRYAVDGPFLIYLQKHGAAHPFFVMWVDNAELLQPDSRGRK
jgi:hypothetical protein